MTDWSRVLEAGWPELMAAGGWTLEDAGKLGTLVFHAPPPHPTAAQIAAKAVELAPAFAEQDTRRRAVKAFAARYAYEDLFEAIVSDDDGVIAAIREDAGKALRGERVEPRARTAIEQAVAARRGR